MIRYLDDAGDGGNSLGSSWHDSLLDQIRAFAHRLPVGSLG